MGGVRLLKIMKGTALIVGAFGVGLFCWIFYLDTQVSHQNIKDNLLKSGATKEFTVATVKALQCAQSSWNPLVHPLRPYMAAVDLDQRATKKRYWLFDIRTGQILLHRYVAHGQNSGSIHKARKFSNIEQSKKSSLGLYWVAHSYWSGTTKRTNTTLLGLDSGFNDNARKRHIILHPAHSVTREEYVTTKKVTGRSDGCIALDKDGYAESEAYLSYGGLIFQYASATSDGKDFAAEAWSLHCDE